MSSEGNSGEPRGPGAEHSHCTDCRRQACSVRPDGGVTSCKMVPCPRGCERRYHACKETEHALLCLEGRVSCINSGYGCPLVLPRKGLTPHLPVCPASVIYCGAEWNRASLDVGLDGKPLVMLRKLYSDCGQLDLALALRDHRVLVDSLLAPSQTQCSLGNPLTRRHAAAPIGPTSSAPIGPTSLAPIGPTSSAPIGPTSSAPIGPPSARRDADYSEEEGGEGGMGGGENSKGRVMHCNNEENYHQDSDLMRKKLSLLPDPPASSSETAGALTSALDSFHSLSLLSETNSGHDLLSADQMDCLSDACGAEREAETAGTLRGGSQERDKQVTQVENNSALRGALSVELEVQCITKYQGQKRDDTLTFPCAQPVRRDQFSNHFHAVHHRIQPDLNSWLEQRCPLAYLGCPFSWRRLRPGSSSGMSGMSVCHSWLLESFGLTSRDPRHDPLHRPPSHVLPAGPTVAEGGRKAGDVLPGAMIIVEGGRKVGNVLAYDVLVSGREDSNVGLSSRQSPSRACGLSTPTTATTAGLSLSAAAAADASGRSTAQSIGLSTTTTPSSANKAGLSGEGLFQENQNVLQCNNPLPCKSSDDQTKQSKGNQIIYSGTSANSCMRVHHAQGTEPADEKDTCEPAGDKGSSSSYGFQLVDMPAEILCYLTQFLDSFSLCNMSLVSRMLREVCRSVLQERGVVSLVWEKQHAGETTSWQMTGKRWSFSTCFSQVPRWEFTGPNPIPEHLKTCPYNQDRHSPSQRFSIIPLQGADPVDVQIRDMLQERMQRRRPSGRPRWYIAAMKSYVESLCHK